MREMKKFIVHYDKRFKTTKKKLYFDALCKNTKTNPNLIKND